MHTFKQSAIIIALIWVMIDIHIVAFGCVYLAVNKGEVLLYEQKIEKGQPLPEWAVKETYTKAADEADLDCLYFTGLALHHELKYYASNDFMGVASCPLIQFR